MPERVQGGDDRQQEQHRRRRERDQQPVGAARRLGGPGEGGGRRGSDGRPVGRTDARSVDARLGPALGVLRDGGGGRLGARGLVGGAAMAGLAAMEITVAAMSAERVNCDELGMAPLWVSGHRVAASRRSFRRKQFRVRNARVTGSGTVGGEVAVTDFRISGPLEVRAGEDSSSASTGARQRALLAILLLHVGEVVSSDRLMDELWGDEPPEAGATALRVRVSQLRRALGPAGELLVTRAPGYVMALAPEQLDLRRFEGLVDAGAAALARDDPAAAVERLRDGARRCGAARRWRTSPTRRSPRRRSSASKRCGWRRSSCASRRELALGRHAQLVGELQALVGRAPAARAAVRPADACAVPRRPAGGGAGGLSRDAPDRLVDEIGLEPGPELQDLERRILDQDESLMIGRPAPRPAARDHPRPGARRRHARPARGAGVAARGPRRPRAGDRRVGATMRDSSPNAPPA